MRCPILERLPEQYLSQRRSSDAMFLCDPERWVSQPHMGKLPAFLLPLPVSFLPNSGCKSVTPDRRFPSHRLQTVVVIRRGIARQQAAPPSPLSGAPTQSGDATNVFGHQGTENRTPTGRTSSQAIRAQNPAATAAGVASGKGSKSRVTRVPETVSGTAETFPARRRAAGSTSRFQTKPKSKSAGTSMMKAKSTPPPLRPGDHDRYSSQVRMTGFNSPVIFSKNLADAIMDGERVMSRAQASSRVSAYVRSNGLQHSDDGRVFTLDGKLTSLFPNAPPVLPHRSITSILKPHVIPLQEASEDLQDMVAGQKKSYIERAATKLAKKGTKLDRRGHHSAKVQDKMRAMGSGMFKPVGLSDSMADICDGHKKLARSEVTKWVWKYIKDHQLQDNENRRTIHLDAKLQRICDDMRTVDCFKLSKYISAQLKRQA